MLISGNETFLNQRPQTQKRESVKSKGNAFEDVLQNTHKKSKKSEERPQQSAQTTKKKNDDLPEERSDLNKPQQQVAAKKQYNEEGGFKSIQGSLLNSSNGQSGEGVDSDLQSLSLSKGPFQFGNPSEKNTENVDSLNLSGLKTETLGKNISSENKIGEGINLDDLQMTQLEKPVELPADLNKESSADLNIMPKELVAASAKQNQSFKPVTLAEQGVKTLKVDSEMKPSETLEGALSSIGEGLNELKVESKSSSEKAGEDFSSDLESFLGQNIEQDLQKQDVDSGLGIEESLKIGEQKSERIENMNSIIKQARAFVDDGGGSMEIHLQPEGLGKVHLKVAVQDGQVNVEMLTDNAQAKRALEESLADVKTALEGQKLLVETLKVEMSQDYQKDFTDLQQHMQEQANRDFAQDFLGQFRQEREERVSGLFDAFRTFQPKAAEPELTLNRRNPYSEAGKGRKVNLVA